MSLYVKDNDQPTGWQVQSHRKKMGEGAPVTADGMDEGADEGSEMEEPEQL